MNSDIFSWLLVLEVALPFFVLSVILIVVLVRGQKKYKEAARNLILKIKNNEDNEREALLKFLTDKVALDDKEAKKASKKIINERKFLFRNLISGLLDKNTDAIAALEADMSRITARYHALEISQAIEEAAPEVDESEQENIDELKQEVKSLKHEVHITLTTLNNIFAEFSSMFGEEVPETEMSVDQIITAMESFSGKSAASPEKEVEEDIEESVSDEAELEEESIDAFAEVEGVLDEAVEEDEDIAEEAPLDEPNEEAEEASNGEVSLDFSLDDELDDIDSALDELELGHSSEDDEPSWDEAFEESGDKKPD